MVHHLVGVCTFLLQNLQTLTQFDPDQPDLTNVGGVHHEDEAGVGPDVVRPDSSQLASQFSYVNYLLLLLLANR